MRSSSPPAYPPANSSGLPWIIRHGSKASRSAPLPSRIASCHYASNSNAPGGGNDALLATQDKLQDRLARQEDELDDLKGNLNNTSSRLGSELTQARAAIEAAEASRDSLKENQRELVKEFEAGLTKAAALMQTALDSVLAPEQFRITISGGEVVMSIQEDVLFTPRSVSRLHDNAGVVLRTAMDALQANPLLKLTVIGHTDNRPNPRRGTNNWEYASLRATHLAEELASTYYLSPNRVEATSQGEFRPIAGNDTEEGRTTNRRVDFVLRNNVANLLRELQKL